MGLDNPLLVLAVLVAGAEGPCRGNQSLRSRDRPDAAEPVGRRLADVPAHAQCLRLQPAEADQQAQRQERAARMDNDSRSRRAGSGAARA